MCARRVILTAGLLGLALFQGAACGGTSGRGDSGEGAARRGGGSTPNLERPSEAGTSEAGPADAAAPPVDADDLDRPAEPDVAPEGPGPMVDAQPEAAPPDQAPALDVNMAPDASMPGPCQGRGPGSPCGTARCEGTSRIEPQCNAQGACVPVTSRCPSLCLLDRCVLGAAPR